MPKPDGPYSYAIKVDSQVPLLFLSGLASRDEEGKGLIGYVTYYGKSKSMPNPPGAYTQTMRAMERLSNLMKAEGATFNDVIHAKIWLQDISYWENGVREAFEKHFTNHYPTIAVTAINHTALGSMVEIEMVAVGKPQQ